MKSFKIAVLFCLFISASCYHFPGSKMAERQISSVDGLLPIPKAKKFDPDLREYERALGQSDVCMKDICGEANSALSVNDVVEQEKNLKIYVPGSAIYQRMDMLLRSYGSQIVIADGTSGASLRYLAAHPEFPITPLWKEFFNRLHYTRILMTAAFKAQAKSGIFSQSVQWSGLNEQMFDLLNISAADKAWAKRVFTSGAFADFIKANEDFQTYNNFFGARAMSAEKYPKLSYPMAVRRLVADCRKELDRVSQILGTSVQRGTFPICSGDVGYIDERALGGELAQLSFMKTWVTTDFHPLMQERNVDWNRAVKHFITTPEFRIQHTLPYVPVSQWKNKLDEAVQQCHSLIGPAIEHSPDQRKLRMVHESIGEIKRVSKKIIHFQNAKLQQQFDRGLDRTGFQLPMSAGDLTGAIEKRLKLMVSATRQQNQMLSNPANPEFAFNIIDATQVDPDLGEGPAESLSSYVGMLLSQLTEVCGSYVAEGFGDFMYTEVGESVISWSSVKYLDVGYGVIAHETGHRVSELLQQIGKNEKGSYYLGLSEKIPAWEKRACVNSFHGDTKEKWLNGENMKAEEDWADQFAALVVKEARAQKPWLKNYGCVLADRDSRRTNEFERGYRELDQDSHSNGAFRTMIFEQSLNGLKPMCKKSLKAKSALPACFYEN